MNQKPISKQELINALYKMDLHFLETLPRKEKEAIAKLLTPKLTKYVPHVPTAKQSAFLLLDCKEAFYGGAAGGGKSDALLMAALQYIDVPGYSAILFRRTFADLVKPGALIDRAKQWLMPYQDSGEVKWNEKEKCFNFYDAYGKHRDLRSRLQFGYLETANDCYTYQGGEYHFCGFDEVCQMLESNYLYLFSRSRKLKGVNVPIRLRGASNPPGPGQGRWVYDRFVNPRTVKPGTIFIPAGLDDNPFLDKEDYLEALDELDPVTRAQLRDGNWTIQRSGNMFKEEWLEIVDSIPAGARCVRYWDMASTADPKKVSNRNKNPDYTSGCKMWEKNGIFYLENVKHGRWSSAETQSIQQSTAMEDGYACPIIEEQEPGSSGDAAIELKNKFLLGNFNYKGIRSSGSKIQRAEYASNMAEKRRIKVLRPFAQTEKWQDLVAELTGFPEAEHDDFVDSFSGAINYLAAGIGNDTPPQVVTEQERQVSYWESKGGIDLSEYMEDMMMQNGQYRESMSESDSYWRDI